MRHLALLAVALGGAAVPTAGWAQRYGACPSTITAEYRSELRSPGQGMAAVFTSLEYDYVVKLSNSGPRPVAYQVRAIGHMMEEAFNRLNIVGAVSNMIPRSGRLQPG